jgi:glycosyltransferase involved in cell wall biosynthesis
MTIYNASSYLHASIKSLLNQSFTDWELIAINNGSTDNSLKIISNYSDKRIKIYNFKKNIGRVQALRFAFNQSNAEFIAILDADDIACPQRFIKQIKFIDKDPKIALIATWAKYINQKGEVIGTFKPSVLQGKLQDYLGWTNPFPHSSVLIRSKYLKEVGGYPLNFKWGHDMALFIKLAARYPIGIIDQYLCHIRIHDSNMTTSPTQRLQINIERQKLFEMACKSIILSENAKRLNRGAIAFSKIRIGKAHIYSGSFFRGLKDIVRVLLKDVSYVTYFIFFKLTKGRILIKIK